ncbi:hypothetical protein AOL_s00043g394 [Orbilia oligospora ATCC 24927]|uniref:Uncharacterized protein n=1 Tax=Arthrobotrys oligospora (strain ATCC 24927 / CBS 115.81 / DSM 1491) TaxID=756982 RepID=G1X3X0_ARTOA|nr:hypothetical protein AOL_s00043g394 [Orbilia oligospora ATCC 24927]EGX52251.1 hypothetical protein AOL_s00043g394 [Orbilia oligospora ATCC 24927]
MSISFLNNWSTGSRNAAATVFRALPANVQTGILSSILQNDQSNLNQNAILDVLQSLPTEIKNEILSDITNLTSQLPKCRNTLDIVRCVFTTLSPTAQETIVSNIPIIQEQLTAHSVTPEVRKEVLANITLVMERLGSREGSPIDLYSILEAIPDEVQVKILSNLSSIKEQVTTSSLPVESQTEIIESLNKLKDQYTISSRGSAEATEPTDAQGEGAASLKAQYIKASNGFEIHAALSKPEIYIGCLEQFGMVIQYIAANMSGTQTPWVDISEHSFLDEPIFLPQKNEGNGVNDGPTFVVKLSLDREDSSLSLGQLVFEVERTATIKTLITAIAAKARPTLAARVVVLNKPCRISLRRAPDDGGNVCIVTTITTNPKPGHQPGLAPLATPPAPRAPRPDLTSSGLPKRRMPKLAAAQFFTQLEQKGKD